jgi:hypothetical protein
MEVAGKSFFDKSFIYRFAVVIGMFGSEVG